eukprot:755222-Hanusia_phi.AAC.2
MMPETLNSCCLNIYTTPTLPPGDGVPRFVANLDSMGYKIWGRDSKGVEGERWLRRTVQEWRGEKKEKEKEKDIDYERDEMMVLREVHIGSIADEDREKEKQRNSLNDVVRSDARHLGDMRSHFLPFQDAVSETSLTARGWNRSHA